jgi:hypothetical protein
MDNNALFKKLTIPYEEAGRAYSLLDGAISNMMSGQHVDPANQLNLVKGAQKRLLTLTKQLESVLDEVENELIEMRRQRQIQEEEQRWEK